MQHGMLDLIARKQEIELLELREKRNEEEYKKASKQVRVDMKRLGEELN